MLVPSPTRTKWARPRVISRIAPTDQLRRPYFFLAAAAFAFVAC